MGKKSAVGSSWTQNVLYMRIPKEANNYDNKQAIIKRIHAR